MLTSEFPFQNLSFSLAFLLPLKTHPQSEGRASCVHVRSSALHVCVPGTARPFGFAVFLPDGLVVFGSEFPGHKQQSAAVVLAPSVESSTGSGRRS